MSRCFEVPPFGGSEALRKLERENELLRQKCIELGNGTNDFLHSPQQSLTGSSRDTIAPEEPDSQKDALLYHGPTSAAHDDTTSLDENDGGRIDSISDEDWTRTFLFSATAKQRQLEPLNLAAGRLDFDGVDPETGMELLSIYWSRQMYTAQIIYRPLFMRDMACGGPYFSKLLLNAVFFAVSKHCARPGIRSNPDDITTAGYAFRQRFSELLRDCFDKSEITTLQALLIMSNSLFSRCDERSLSWLYAGNAFNMLIDLGLHVLPSSGTLPPEEYELRRRILWGAYTIDKIQCLFQGRPPLLRRLNFEASLRFLDEYDELDLVQHTTYAIGLHQLSVQSYNVSLLTKLCEISMIIERILCDVYSESRVINRTLDPGVLNDIELSLTEWRETLPPQLDYLSSPGSAVILPQNLCLLALYNALIILSQRPSINDSQENKANSVTALEAVKACTAAANQIVQILDDYSQNFCISSAPYLLSYAAYISATIHARVVAQTGPSSNAFHSLLLCRNVLRKNEVLYSAAVKARTSLDKLMDQLGITLSDGNTETGSPGGTIPTTEIPVDRDPSSVPDTSFPSDAPCSPQLDWELSGLDLEAIVQGFQPDGDFSYLMYPSGNGNI
ncbi:predicted protein [Paecilomyces variotii No. 5]|uniref:Xylanolytic transcriptional activator regulatory domain-containing protein n=1 Tax=Byssochlamys spectabilis (strain No. 5 / NBRC 109023) TaxID=1356009 RepID=V5I2R0_BYSSN|nr:predicted protein [Paecilomyces variotii No. 5]